MMQALVYIAHMGHSSALFRWRSACEAADIAEDGLWIVASQQTCQEPLI
jgi:hypothetical protein